VLSVGDRVADDVLERGKESQETVREKEGETTTGRTTERKRRKAKTHLEEDLENTTGLLIDETRDTLDTATTSETTDRGLGDTLDVVTKLLVREREGQRRKKRKKRGERRHTILR
jgi:hypothetical protein